MTLKMANRTFPCCGQINFSNQPKTMCPVCTVRIPSFPALDRRVFMWRAAARREKIPLAEWIRRTLDKAVA